MNYILTSLVALAVSIGSIFGLGGFQEPQTESLGATLPIAGATYNLAGSGISGSATTITLQSLTIPQSGYKIQDSDLSDTFYMTLEPGNRSKQEIVSCTTVAQNANNTATLTGCTRGLSPITPFTASSTLQFSHAGGSQVIFSDPPQLFNQYLAKANNEAITGLWQFTDPPIVTNAATATNQLASVSYVNSISISGAATSTENVQGLVRLPTLAQMLAGTASSTTGVVGQPLVVPLRVATTAPQSAGGYVPVTDSSGKLPAHFIATTSPFVWTGTHSFSASSTQATTTFTGKVFNGNITNSYTSGETITGLVTPVPVTWATSSARVFIADGNVASTTNFFGFAVNTSAAGGTAYVQTSGIVGGLTGLTPGLDYFVSDTAGSLSSTPGTSEIHVGIAVSATQILIQNNKPWQYLGSQTLTSNADVVINQPYARFGIISCSVDNSNGGGKGTVTIAKVGIVSAICQENTTVGSNSSATYTWTSTSSIRTFVDGNNTPTQTGTIYYYR